MTADGDLSPAMATTNVNKSGDVMNGPLSWANSGSVSTFNRRESTCTTTGRSFAASCPLPNRRVD
jgi:hypothetical protein